MREATDLGIGAAVRRELAGRRIDLSKIKFPVKAGVVTLQGELAFGGIDKTADETAIELKFIESALRQIAGVKDTIFELENWSKNDSGVWESSTQPLVTASEISTGEGLYCDDCDMVIRFCPCCGKPLAASTRSAGRPRRTVPPVKAIIRKKKPVITPIAPATSPTSPTIGEVPAAPPSAPPALPATPVIPTVKPMPAKPIAMPTISEEKLVTPVAPAPRPLTPARPAEKPAVPVSPVKPATPATPPATPVKPLITPAAQPVLVAQPEVAKPAMPAEVVTPVPAAKPAPKVQTITEKPIADEMNLDNLNLNLDGVSPEKPGVPMPDFMKSDEQNEDLFGSLIDNLSQSGSDSSSAQAESDDFSQDQTSADENVPDINLDSLDNFSTPALEAQTPEPSGEDIAGMLPDADDFSDDIADLLPPMKPSVKPTPAQRPDPFASIDDDTPLPPMKPVDAVDSFDDDDTPLPPMRPKAPAKKESKDPFAALSRKQTSD